MPRVSLAIASAVLTVVCAAPGSAQTRHSGDVVAVDAGGASITISEIAAGPRGTGKSQVINRTVALTPETKITLVTRAGERETAEWPGGFKETPMPAADLRKGDFATVDLTRRDGRWVALSVTVVRPASEPR